MHKLIAAIQGIDWKLLKNQKEELLGITIHMVHDEQYNAIQGIINLLDSLQDAAIDDGVTTKADALNLTPEPDGQLEISGHSIAWQSDVQLNALNDDEILEISDQLLSLNEGELPAQGREGTITWWKE